MSGALALAVLRHMRVIDDMQARCPAAPWTRPPGLGQRMTAAWAAYETPRRRAQMPDAEVTRWLAETSASLSAYSGRD